MEILLSKTDEKRLLATDVVLVSLMLAFNNYLPTE